MSKTKVVIGFICFLAISALVLPPKAYTDQYYDQYPGNCFVPKESTSSYVRNVSNGYIYHDGTEDEYYLCPVNFNVPDGSPHFIKSIGIRFRDNHADGYVKVVLKRLNLYTGNDHTVAEWQSDFSDASFNARTASQGTVSGYKLVDSKKFMYWLYVQFYADGAVNPGDNLVLIQVRVHYGT